MKIETEFAIDQQVRFSFPDGEHTGKVVGRPLTPEMVVMTLNEAMESPDIFIVLLDYPVNGQKAILVSASLMEPVHCFWCKDSKLVQSYSFTGEQYDTDTIPMRDCPYCTGGPNG